MNSSREIAIVLEFTVDEAGSLRRQASATMAEIEQNAEALTDLEHRAAALAAQIDGPVPVQLQSSTSVSGPAEAVEPPTWDELVDRATSRLPTDDGSSHLPDLIPESRAEDIDQRHGTIRVKARLDSIDVAAAVAAAAIGTAIDYSVVRIPVTILRNGVVQPGSRMTMALRNQAVPADNWIAALAYVPFDRVAGIPIDGMSPRSHRVQTFGHDPLLGLVLGTTDIVRGTLTGANPHGVVQVIDTGTPLPHLGAALGLEVAHLLSDMITPMGVPLPGWTALMAVPKGGIGPDFPVAALARWMYLHGYGSWHFLTMATMPAAIEAVLLAYVGIRRMIDEDYDAAWRHQKSAAGADEIAAHPRFRAMSLIAHALGVCGNAGRVAFTGGNPLAVNYAQWAVFIGKIIPAIWPADSAEQTIGIANANRLALDTGWAKLGIDADALDLN